MKLEEYYRSLFIAWKAGQIRAIPEKFLIKHWEWYDIKDCAKDLIRFGLIGEKDKDFFFRAVFIPKHDNP